MVSDRPWPWGILSLAVLVVLAIPLFSITLGQPGMTWPGAGG
jgi:uncharacterized membrane protein YdfJ with MMPL/SSD domain